MTFDAMSWAIESTVPNPAKAVLVALANWSDENESCSPSIERIAHGASITPEQVTLELAFLEKSGLISVQTHYGDRAGAIAVRYFLQLGVDYPPAAASQDAGEE